jgi:hypothetical protein
VSAGNGRKGRKRAPEAEAQSVVERELKRRVQHDRSCPVLTGLEHPARPRLRKQYILRRLTPGVVEDLHVTLRERPLMPAETPEAAEAVSSATL